MSNSINTNIAAFYAQENITTASNQATSSVARLSSGNAIVNASDNVTALAIGTSIGTQVSILNTAQTNANQGTSLLQVADGALAQIQSILQQQQSIANQAQSGTLTDTDRGFLNEEFQTLSNEINALASGTTFNGVSLINGAIAGSASLNTNTTDGSTALPVTATIATIGTNVVAGNTFTVTIAGQPSATLTFGNAAGDVAVGATASDSLANLAAALNNSGLSQLADFSFQSNGTTLSAYYTGKTTGISNIPALTIGNTGTAITSTASPTFSAATQIGSLTGVAAVGDTFTIGSHTITLDANGSNPTTGYAVNGSNGTVDIGTAGSTNGVTGTAISNLVSFLNSVAGTAGWTDLSGITFSTNATGTPQSIYAAYSGGGATQPTLSTAYTSNSANMFSGGTSDTINASTSIFTAAAQLSVGDQISIDGGSAITFVGNSATAGAGQVNLGSTLGGTLTNLAAFLNTAANQGTYIGSSGTGVKPAAGTAIFSTDGANNLYANNTTTTGVAYTGVSTTYNHTIVSSTNHTAYGATNYATLGDTNTAASNTVAKVILSGSAAAAGDTATVGGLTITFGAGGTSGNGYINVTTDTTLAEQMTDVAAYLNTSAAHTAAGTALDGVVFSVNGSGQLIGIDATDAALGSGVTATKTGSNLTVGAGSGAAMTQQNGSVIALTGSGVLAVGTSLQIGDTSGSGTAATTVVLGTQAQINAGTAQVLVGVSDAATLKNLSDYLNSTAGQTALGNGLHNAGFFFTYDTTHLYIANNTSTAFSGTATPAVTLNAANIQGTDNGTIITSQTLSSASIAGSFSGTAAIAAGGVLTTGANAIIGTNVTSATNFSIGGETITFGNAAAVAGGTADVLIGGSNAATLANLATYLNTSAAQAGLTGNYKGLTFSSDATHLIATNSTGASVTPGSNTSFSAGAPVGSSGYTAAAIANNASVNVATLSAGTSFSGFTTVNLGTDNTITFGTAAQVAAGTADVTLGTNNFETLQNLVTYLNGTTVNGALKDNYNGLTFSTDGTHLIATNGNTSGTITPGSSASFSAGAPTGASGWTAAGILHGTSVDLLTMGVNTLVFGSAAQVTAGTANVNSGTSLAQSLDNAVSYLNTNELTGTNGTNVVFSTNGTNLLAQNSDGSTTTLTSAFTSTSAAFTGVTGKLITASGVVGLGAGTTSAQGTPGGSILVQDTGTSATNYGQAVNLSLVSNNADFVGAFGGTGSIGAISANYVNTGITATSGVQFTVVVGNDTYTTSTIQNSQLSGTAPVTLTFTGNNTVTSAAEGGSFTLTLQPQTNITSQNQATQLATGINASLSSVSAYQNRNVLSFNNNYSATVGGQQVATLAGSSLSFNSNDFTDPNISSITVTAPSTGSTDAKISAVIDGDTYSTISGIGDNFGANSEITLVNASNPNQTLTLTLGAAGSANLSSASDATAFQTALSNALGLSSSSGGLTFQLGANSASQVTVNIGDATTQSLFGGLSLDVSTSGDAATASTAVSTALNTITASRASVGAYETQFNFAAAALQSSVQNETAAQSSLLDTNIATESTNYATEQVKLQAGISVLAQANQQLQQLLKLIG